VSNIEFDALFLRKSLLRSGWKYCLYSKCLLPFQKPFSSSRIAWECNLKRVVYPI